MTKNQLIKALEKIPDDAILYVASDHGQTPEQCSDITWVVTNNPNDLTYYGEELDWNENEKLKSMATAFLIS